MEIRAARPPCPAAPSSPRYGDGGGGADGAARPSWLQAALHAHARPGPAPRPHTHIIYGAASQCRQLGRNWRWVDVGHHASGEDSWLRDCALWRNTNKKCRPLSGDDTVRCADGLTWRPNAWSIPIKSEAPRVSRPAMISRLSEGWWADGRGWMAGRIWKRLDALGICSHGKRRRGDRAVRG